MKTLVDIKLSIVVWIRVTIIPIVVLYAVVLSAVYDIGPVVYDQVMSVGAVFVSVPVVIIMVVPIVDSYLNLLSFGFEDRYGRRTHGRSQE